MLFVLLMYSMSAMNLCYCSRINYVQASIENFSAGVSPRIIKTICLGLARARVALCQRPGADTEEAGRYDLAWKDLCECSECSGK